MNLLRLLLVTGLLTVSAVARAETPVETPSPADSDAPPPLKTLPPIIFAEDVYFYLLPSPERPLEERLLQEGQFMASWVVFENGAWREVSNAEVLPFYRAGTPLFSMRAPSQAFTLSSVVPAAHGYPEGLHFVPKASPPDSGEIMCSKPVWASAIRPAANPPAVEELSRRMLAALEDFEQNDEALHSERAKWSGDTVYDPRKLKAPQLEEALEFEIAPGETAMMVTLRREYKWRLSDRKDCRSDLGSYWSTIVLQEGLEPLWSMAWVAEADRNGFRCPDLRGVADVNGDGVTEVVLSRQGYEETYYDLYSYEKKKLTPLLSVEKSY